MTGKELLDKTNIHMVCTLINFILLNTELTCLMKETMFIFC